MTDDCNIKLWTMMTSDLTYGLLDSAKLMASLYCDFSTSIITWTMENNYLGASNFPHMGVKWGSTVYVYTSV